LVRVDRISAEVRDQDVRASLVEDDLVKMSGILPFGYRAAAFMTNNRSESSNASVLFEAMNDELARAVIGGQEISTRRVHRDRGRN
jgi:hypothetical protein